MVGKIYNKIQNTRDSHTTLLKGLVSRDPYDMEMYVDRFELDQDLIDKAREAGLTLDYGKRSPIGFTTAFPELSLELAIAIFAKSNLPQDVKDGVIADLKANPSAIGNVAALRAIAHRHDEELKQHMADKKNTSVEDIESQIDSLLKKYLNENQEARDPNFQDAVDNIAFYFSKETITEEDIIAQKKKFYQYAAGIKK